MTKNTKNILLIGGGVVVAGVIVYMIFAPKGTSNTLAYRSGTITTNPQANTNTTLTNAGIQTGQTIVNKLLDKLFAPSTPSTPSTPPFAGLSYDPNSGYWTDGVNFYDNSGKLVG